MKKKFFIILLVFGVLLFSSCASSNNVNKTGISTNPIAPTKPIESLVPSKPTSSTESLIQSSSTNSTNDFSNRIRYELFEDHSLIIVEYISRITEVIIPELVIINDIEYTVTGIDNRAFAGKNITSIFIPKSVEYIGKRAFYNCYYLTEIEFEDNSNLVDIGEEAFSNCSIITNIILPTSVKSIGESAFLGCDKLNTLSTPVIGGGTSSTYYFGYLFDGYSNYVLSAEKVPTNLETVIFTGTEILGYGFMNCTNIKSIIISDTVKEIGTNAFKNCNNLEYNEYENGYYLGNENNLYLVLVSVKEAKDMTSFNVHSSTRVIMNHVFKDITSLSSIDLPSNLLQIGEGAFLGCDSLTNLSIPSTLEIFGKYAINDIEKIKLNEYENGYYLGNDDNPFLIFISVIDKSVTEFEVNESTKIIWDYAFNDCINLVDITFSKSIIHINELAFYGAEALTNVIYKGTIENWCNIYFGVVETKLNFIYSNPMSLAKSIKMLNSNNELYEVEEIVIPDTITTISYFQFADFDNVTKITIPKSVQFILPGAFSRCDNLKSIDIPDSVKYIDMAVFLECKNLETVKLPAKLRHISYFLFDGCEKLKDIVLPSRISSIGIASFRNCKSLEVVSIPSKVEIIGIEAFVYCEGIKVLTFEKNSKLMEIGEQAFSFLINLESLELPDSLEIIGKDCFSYLESITTITIPEKLKSIPDYAFSCCYSLEEVIFDNAENRQVSIGKCAFYNCSSLVRFDWEVITSIGESGFAFCDSLEEVNLTRKVSEIGFAAFEWCCNIKSLTFPFDIIDGFESKSLGYYFGSENYEDNKLYTPRNLESITLTSGINVSEYTLYGFDEIKNIYATDDNPFYTSIDGVLFSNDLSELILYPVGRSGDYEIPKSVRKIRAYAFLNCKGLSNITFAENSKIEEISIGAFYNCELITNIDLPDSIYSLSSAFVGTKITTLTIPNSVNYVSDYILEDTNINNVIIKEGSSISTIDNSAFREFCGLKSITLSSSIREINDFAFYHCYGLTDVYYSGSIVDWLSIDIGIEANPMYPGKNFYILNSNNEYELLKKVVVPDEITVLKDECFGGFDCLEEVYVHKNVTSIGKLIFSKCKNINSLMLPIINDDFYLYELFENFNSQLSQSLKTIEFSSAESIKTNFLSGFFGIEKIILPSNIKNIGGMAYYGCPNIKEIYYYGTLEQWCDITYSDVSDSGSQTYITPMMIANSFYMLDENEEWKELTELVIPSTVTEIKAFSFAGFNHLTKIIIPSDVTKIHECAFYQCSNIKSIAIPNSVSSIGTKAFSCCTSLESVVLSSELTIIEDELFSNCSNLMSIEIPNSVTKICNNVFENCSALNEITIPESVIEIGTSILSGCNNLEKIKIPFVGQKKDGSGVNYFSYLFGCSSPLSEINYVPEAMKEVIITGGEAIYENAFSNCTSLNLIEIPSSVTSIGSYAFSNCLCDIVWNNPTIETIGSYSFGEYKGSKITIPSSVTSIGSYAFYSCVNITNLEISTNVKNIGEGALNGCISLESLTIPFVGAKAGITSSDTYQYPFGYIFGKKYVSGYFSTVQYYYGSSTTNTTATEYYIPSSLKDVTVLGGNILYGAFYDCSDLTNVTISDGVKSIGDKAFYNCSSLKNISLPKGLISIGSYAFWYCSSITNLTIPDGVTSIGEKAFHCCTKLTSIILPNSMTDIGDYAFESCNNLTNITIPSNVTSIGYAAFSKCYNLMSVTLLSSPSINSYAFSMCYKLVEVYNLSSLDITIDSNDNGGIGYYAKAIHTSLEEESIVQKTLDGYSFLYYNNEYYLLGYYGNDTEIVLPNYINGKNYEIYAYAFCMNKDLESITIPNSITRIGESSFADCSNLINVYYKGSIEDWSNISFRDLYANPMSHASHFYLNDENNNWYEVTEIEIPDSITKIGCYKFIGFDNVRSITIPNGVTHIEDHAFYNCSSLETIVIPNSVTHIEDDAFYNCSSLETIVIPNGLKYIEDYGFCNCSSLETIVIPNGAIIIGTNAFNNCSSLANVYYEGSIEDWCNISFESNKSNPMSYASHFYMRDNNNEWFEVTEIEIPNTVETIDNYQFTGFSNITSVTIPDSVISIGGYAFYECYKLVEIYNLSSLDITIGSTNNGYIGYYAMAIHSSLEEDSSITTTSDGYKFINYNNEYSLLGYIKDDTKIVLPESINGYNYKIYQYAFMNNESLTSITIPNTITNIEKDAFYGCSSLVNVYYEGSIEDWCNIAFSNECSNPMVYALHFYMRDNNNEWYEVTEIEIPNTITKIGVYQFYKFENVISFIIPNSVTIIETGAIIYCRSLESIYYIGTVLEWSNITIYWLNSLDNNNTYYYSETKPTDTTYKYWHYNSEGAIVAW